MEAYLKSKKMCRLPVVSAGSLPSLLLILTLICNLSTQTAASLKHTVTKTLHFDTASGLGTENFKDNEKFRDMFELTEDNFEELVLDAEDPWIVLFTDGTLKREWKTLAVSLRGVVWFGIVNRQQQEDLLEDIHFNVRKNPPARVYPYGGTRQKAKWRDVLSTKEAERIAVDSLPNISRVIDPQAINEFIIESYMTFPPSFPAIFICENEIPVEFKSIALHYNRYFAFGVVKNSDQDDLVTLKYDLAIPGLVVLMSKDYGSDIDVAADAWKEKDYNFQSIGYTAERQGELNYPNLVKFLYSINIQYRHTLPGTNMADNEDVLTMEDVMEVEGQRFDVRYMEDLRRIKGSETVRPKKGSKLNKKHPTGKSEL